MPDTPRTLAEILGLFADNSTGQITPQDLRDFVVSTMVDPDADFLHLARVRSTSAATMDEVYDLSTNTEVTALAQDGFYGAKLAQQASDTGFQIDDPSGWVNPDPVSDTSYWTAGLPAQTTLLLPQGRYEWHALVGFTRDAGGASGELPADTDVVGFYFDYASFDAFSDGVLEGTGLITVWARPAYVRESFGESGNRASVRVYGTFGISNEAANAAGGTVAVVPYMYPHIAPTAYRWLRYLLAILKVA